MHVRRDIWRLHRDEGEWNQTVLAYALAVREMQSQDPPADRPVSWDWTYQTQVHGMDIDPEDGLRSQCQHGSWYFLPWHRMYLGHFESVVRAVVAGLDDPMIEDVTKQAWALPYWDYEPAGNRTLPPEFTAATLPDGSPNPLAAPDRNPWVLPPDSIPLDDNEVSSLQWMANPLFANPVSAASFGGIISGPTHFPLSLRNMGDLEMTPHGTVHMYVGGDMSSFSSAGNDPVFWLHHCNVDRLWEVWKVTGDRMTVITDPRWADDEFFFLDVAGETVTHHGVDVEETGSFDYVYEDFVVVEPVEPMPQRAVRGGVMEPDDDEAVTRSLEPAVLGSEEGITLGRGATDVVVSLRRDRDLTSRAARPSAAQPRVLLYARNITASGGPLMSYSVYLTGSGDDDQVFVGNLALFGLMESMERDDEHQVEYAFDVTDAVTQLEERGQWSWEAARVHIEPSNRAVAEQRPSVPDVTVGSLAIAYQ